MKKSPQSVAQPRHLLPSDQRSRFIDAAREAECSEDETEIRENMKQIATAKPLPKKQRK
jgi:hypothetical protein